MSRIPFSQVLKNAEIDLLQEYNRLYGLFYIQRIMNSTGLNTTLREYCNMSFGSVPYRKTCLSLDDFDDSFNYHFERVPSNFDIDYLVTFCEYSFNLAFSLYNQSNGIVSPMMNIIQAMQMYLQQVLKVIDSIGYMPNQNDGVTDFVPKDQAAISVSEIIDPNLSYKVIEYNHHSMKGDLERKKIVLLSLADKLEGQEKRLKSVNPSLGDNLFFLFNNLNLRHNNADTESKSYKSYIASMKDEEIEQWYDDTYQMCLLAFLEIDNEDCKARIKQLKQDVQS